MKLVTLHRKIKWLSKYGITPSQEKLCSPNYTILQDFKAHQFSWKTHISYPTCVYYGVTNVHFSENLGALFCCNTCLEICPFLSCFRRIYSFETNLRGTKNFNLAQLVCVVHFYIDWFYRFESAINSAPPTPSLLPLKWSFSQENDITSMTVLPSVSGSTKWSFSFIPISENFKVFNS